MAKPITISVPNDLANELKKLPEIKVSAVCQAALKNKVEELGEILRRSFSSGVEEIVEHVGLNTANWQWGRAHSITHKH